MNVLQTVIIMDLENVFVIQVFMMTMVSVKLGNHVLHIVPETIKEIAFVMLDIKCMMAIVHVVQVDKYGFLQKTDVSLLVV